MEKPLTLFEEINNGETFKIKRNKATGESANPIVFRDYESFVAKFQDKEKTTDDTYTPKDVYEAVVKYVGEIYDLTDKQILRPFYPGGDYKNAEYPDNGVVIDNPPFSIFTEITKFFAQRDIPFFLFGNGLTIFNVCGVCTAVVADTQIKFENKAVVKCNFASNLYPHDVIATTAIKLRKYIEDCPSQQKDTKELRKVVKPECVLSVSDMQTIANGDEDFAVCREESRIIKKFGGEALFGNHLLISKAKAQAKAQAKALYLQPTQEEKIIIDKLNKNQQ